MKKVRKKHLKLMVTLLLMLAMVMPLLESAMATEPIIENPPPIIIFINEGTVSGVSAEDLADVLESVKDNIRSKLPLEYQNAEIIIRISDAKLDASKTDDWYVYDHYDSGYWDSTIATPEWYSYFNLDGDSALRPFYTHPQDAKENIPKYKLTEWITANPRPHNYNATDDSLGTFDRHINIRQNALNPKNTMMDFAGYYNSAYFDFMLYPCEVADDKLIVFDISSAQINAHTLGSAGFLINAGFDGNNITGYYLCYHYNATSTENKKVPSQLFLYKFKSGAKPSDFHNYLQGNGSSAVDYSEFFEKNPIASYAIPSAEWKENMSITLEVSPTSLTVYQKETGSPAAMKKVLDVNNMADTSFSGFGPVVGYVTHGCVRATMFTFGNIKMYQTNPDNLAAILSGANLDPDSEAYFVDLSDNPRDGDDYDNAVDTMADRGIHYLPDYSGSALDTNGNLKGEQLKESDLNALANEIADYIVKTYQKPAQTDDSEPVARLTLVSKEYEDDNGGRSPAAIRYVRRDLIDGTGFVFAFDVLSAPSNGETIIKYSYTVIAPDGETVTVEGDHDHDSINGLLLQITNDRDNWPAGEYTVTLTVTDSAGKTASDAKTFTIIEDVTPPEIADVTLDFAQGTLSFAASDIGVNNRAPEDGEKTAYGITHYEVVLTPASDDFEYEGGAYQYDAEDGTWIYTGYPDSFDVTAESRERNVSFNDIPLPEGEYTITLKVYDEAGNLTEIKLPAIDYVNETFIGLDDDATYSGLIKDLESVYQIQEEWIGDPEGVEYQSPNSNPSGEFTTVTVILPPRPNAPNGIDAESTGDGNMKLTGVDDTMEYKSDSGERYTSVDSEADSIIVTLDDYTVRYKAVRGRKFAGSPTAELTVDTYNVEVTINLDGSEWSDSDAPTLILKSENSGVELTDLSKVPSGTYKILANGKDTGKTVTVEDNDVSEELNYYTLTLESDYGVEEVGAGGNYTVQLAADKWAVIEGSGVSIRAKLKGGYGWINWDGDERYESQNQSFTMPGTSVTLQANSEYTAVAVTVNLDDSEADEDTDWGDRNKPVITYMGENENEVGSLMKLTGTFEILIDGQPTGKFIEVEDGMLTDPDGGVVLNFYTLTLIAGRGVNSVVNMSDTGAKISRIYFEGAEVTIGADVSSGYYWRYWDDHSRPDNINNQSKTLIMNRNITMTAYASRNIITININKDDSPWTGRTVKLLRTDNGGEITDLSDVPDGVYAIYVDGADTGVVINVSAGSGEETLDFYTLKLIDGNGVSGTNGGGVYLKGSTAEIDASVRKYYDWNGWTYNKGGSGGISEKKSSLIIDSTITLTANASYAGTGGGNFPPYPKTDIFVVADEPEDSTKPTEYGGTTVTNPSYSEQKSNSNKTTVEYAGNIIDSAPDPINESDFEKESHEEESSPKIILQDEPEQQQPVEDENIEKAAENDSDTNDTDISVGYEDQKDEPEVVQEQKIIFLNGGRFAKDLGDGLYEIFDENGIPSGYIKLTEGEKIEEIDIDKRIVLINSTASLPEKETSPVKKKDAPSLPVTGGLSGVWALLLGSAMILAGIAIKNKKITLAMSIIKR